MLEISERQLKELLREAYDAGWYGTKELRDVTVDEIMDKVSFEVEDSAKEGIGWTYNGEPITFTYWSDAAGGSLFQLDGERSLFQLNGEE